VAVTSASEAEFLQGWPFLPRGNAGPGFAERAPAAQVKGLLKFLAVKRHVVAAVRDQVLPALVPFHQQVLSKPCGKLGSVANG
jgi:hypothetical protein